VLRVGDDGRFLKACVTLPAFSSPQKGQSGGSVGGSAAPTARMTIRALLTPVEVWRVKMPEKESWEMDVTSDFWTRLERL